MIETLLASMGVKPSDFQEVITLARTLDTRLTTIEAGLLRIEGELLCLRPAGAKHPLTVTCAVPGGKP